MLGRRTDDALSTLGYAPVSGQPLGVRWLAATTRHGAVGWRCRPKGLSAGGGRGQPDEGNDIIRGRSTFTNFFSMKSMYEYRFPGRPIIGSNFATPEMDEMLPKIFNRMQDSSRYE